MATITSLLSDHVSFELRSIDRIFLQAYCPALQSMGQVIRFLVHKGFPIPSGVALGKIGRAIVADIEAFVSDNDIPVVRFQKKEVKEDVAAPYLERAAPKDAPASSWSASPRRGRARGGRGRPAVGPSTRISSSAASRYSSTTTTSTS